MMIDFTELENRLQSLPNGPSPELRNRVLSAVDRELAARRSGWQAPVWFWAAAAALLMIVLNLSFASAAGDAFSLSRPTSDQAAMEMQALAAIDTSSFPSTATPTPHPKTEFVK